MQNTVQDTVQGIVQDTMQDTMQDMDRKQVGELLDDIIIGIVWPNLPNVATLQAAALMLFAPFRLGYDRARP